MLRLFTVAALLLLAAGPGAAQNERQPPYWASISAGEAMMRTGPGRNYPATWLYQRADLPIRVVEVYPNWRKVQDPDGTTGWMLVHLLSAQRTALVTGAEPRPMHQRPDAGAPIAWRAEPGVVGRISNCDGDWCQLNVGGRRGYILKAHFYGADPLENF